MKKNEKQAVVLQLLVCLTFYILFQNIIMVNLKKKVESNKNTIIQQKQKYVEDVNKINSLEKRYREYYKMKYQRDYMKAKLVGKGEERYLTEELTELSKRNNIKLSNINLTENMGENDRKYIFKTEFETDFLTLKSFLDDIDNLEKNINLENMSISRDNFNLIVKATFSIYTTN
ncbi:type 4a pilus biogenesis protein PilO [uncultured Ilyobacter sp.]|uniref:type 4a pilus biogenesis protein PilO n=1 Tax=uncultured Ilyobacter sp. TaxID=544433 RepID=UPI0029C0F49C|nr:type 4a pilus biogenesis protein PilO [uncultured Ilyobacter sp.]